MIIEEGSYLKHYGILRKSGRYPYGSGGPETSGTTEFLGYAAELKGKGLSEPDIAKAMGISTTELRAVKSIAKNEVKAERIAQAQRLSATGMSTSAVAREMKINESSVRALLAPGEKDKADSLQVVSNMLRDQVDSRGVIDIGVGVENHLGISDTRLKNAVAVLKEEGYEVHSVQVDQLFGQNKTTIKVIAPPGTTYRDIVKDTSQIKSINEWSEDGGRSMLGLMTPISVSSSRLDVRYSTKNKDGDLEGGVDADGVIYVRPGVKDLSMGNAQYAQVRIAVDGTHYLKGMAMYKDDLPKGVDLQFNTNKVDQGNKLKALKELKDDPDNPFGSVVRQLGDFDAGGRLTKVTSALNIVNEEGNWESWKKTLSTQVLSKQSPKLAKNQLDQTYDRKKSELDEIMALTNPVVRRKLLDAYATSADSSAIHLKAAGLDRQASHVILPINTLKESEIYAPNYRNGERVALIRYPHGGTFEIPELTVNNNHPDGKKYIGAQARDAVGIHHKVAERLSGADFDGDTVLVIPNNKGDIKSSPALSGLKGFDPQRDYKAYDGMATIDGGRYNGKTGKVDYPIDPKTGRPKNPSPRGKGTQMGLVSNLITDMTIQKAPASEVARAVRHSMVVIDAEKHALDYKRSAQENGITQLYKKYQTSAQGGGATLISRATSRTDVPDYAPRKAKGSLTVDRFGNRVDKDGGPIDKTTGERVFVRTGESYVNGKGKTVVKTKQSVKLAEVRDANELSSGTRIESLYATHSNSLKALANDARRASVNTTLGKYSPSAKLTYKAEVDSLNSKLDIALRNSPRERQAQVIANATVARKREANGEMDKAELSKLKSQALDEARNRVNAKKTLVDITDREWEAIQAGAISNNKLDRILTNTDIEKVKGLATPRTNKVMTSPKQARAQQMLAAGYTQADIADALGVNVATLKSYINGDSEG